MRPPTRQPDMISLPGLLALGALLAAGAIGLRRAYGGEANSREEFAEQPEAEIAPNSSDADIAQELNNTEPTIDSAIDIGGNTVRRQDDLVFWVSSRMVIDYDGAPNAYAPADSGLSPLDKLANAGRPGRWWALLTDTGRQDGQPIVQGPTDPAPGYYISTTALRNKGKSRAERYIDSVRVNYISIPKALKSIGVRLGDIARVTHGSFTAYAIVGDIGPAGKIGEGSTALSLALGGDGHTIEGDVFFEIKLSSGDGSGKSQPEIDDIGAKTKW